MKFTKLTEKQRVVLDVILESIKTKGYPPSIREIGKKTNLSSLRGVVLQLEALEKAGYIQRRSHARGIIVNPSLLEDGNQTFSIPLVTSHVPAGPGFDTDDFSDETFDVTSKQTKGLRNVFAVRVTGDSMVDEGINEGDIAIVFPQQVADDGDIVIADHKGQGVTLKKYRVVEGRPILFPANKKYLPITSEFEVQGKVINVVKG